MTRLIACLALLLVLAGPVRAQAMLDAGAVPGLTAQGQASYREFLQINLPRAFALGSGGAYGWKGGGGTIEQAREAAMASCSAKGPDCRLYAENLDLIWPGRATTAPAPPGPLLSNWNFAAVPDARYFWRGPAAAAGVYVWGHGLGTLNGLGALADSRGAQPQTHVRAFNNAGFDVVRFDREPHADIDKERAGSWLEDVLREMRRLGYRKVVVGGQSRGGWNALQMLRTPGLADVVVAVSPAAHGTGGSTNLTAQYDDMRRMLGGVPQSPVRLAFVQFRADPFAADLNGRAALVEWLRGWLGGVLLVDQPDGFTGHYGGSSSVFARHFAGCILRFATAAGAPGC